jgi:MinD-like ATPase involved in chromosome partitioning or flagellar assembly
VAEIDFADGFDVPEPLAWGLTPAQLAVVVTGALLAYIDLRSPLPRVAAVPLAVVAAMAGLTAALARYEGRSLVAWAAAAARFWTRPRHGLLTIVDGSGRPWRADARMPTLTGVTGSAGPWQTSRAWTPAPPAEVGGGGSGTRLPLVLLPEPVLTAGSGEAADPWPACRPGETVAGVDPQPAVARRSGGPTPLHLADSGLIEVPAWLASTPAGGPGGPPGWAAPRDPVPAPGTALRTARRLTFFSLGGGTGKTTLAVEVAALLADQGRRRAGRGAASLPRVALVDLDLTSPRAGLRLGMPAPADWDLAETDLAGPALGRLLGVHGSGLQVLPGPAGLLPSDAADRPDVVRRLAAAVTALEARGCDTVVLDVAGDLSALTRWALEGAQDIFVVLTPTAGGIQDAYRSTQALRRLGLRHRLRYVVNRHRGEPLIAEAMGDLGGVVIAEVPDDPALELAEMEHRLVGLEARGRTAAALRALAGTVDARVGARRPGQRPPLLSSILRRRAG